MVSQISSTPWTLQTYVDDHKEEWAKNLIAYGAKILLIHEPQRMGSDLFVFRKLGTVRIKVVQSGRLISYDGCNFKDVYEAFEFTKGKKYALSKIKPHYNVDMWKLIEYAETEIDYLRKFNGSKFVLTTTCAGKTKTLDGVEQVYILTKYCEEGDLEEHLEKLDIHQLFQITQDLITALTEFKKLNLLHQDIKPKNIFLYRHKKTKALRARLGDLGLVAVACEIRYDGDDEYFSPFKQTCKGYSTFQSDVWALGYVIHIMIYGRMSWGSLNYCFKRPLTQDSACLSKERLAKFTQPIDRLIFGMMNPDESKALSIEQAQALLSTMQPSDFVPTKGK